jgi:hypothetical protein
MELPVEVSKVEVWVRGEGSDVTVGIEVEEGGDSEGLSPAVNIGKTTYGASAGRGRIGGEERASREVEVDG